ncbi:hypothetical protein [Janthinobacterium sp. J1-1]|uniref:hypothetical protein n=1 Tax=Janthinobacterium sp. J1-1 TaxID=3065910 RepID=UPI002812275F|nr:hypothetical protein [Janthinobacterium sp. J1-1]
MQTKPDIPTLQLRTLIDAAALERMAPELEEVFLARLLANRVRGGVEQRLQASERQMHEAFARSPRLHALTVWASGLGLLIALAFAARGGLVLRGHRLDIIFLGFFGVILALLVLLPRVIVWQRQPWEKLWRAIARRIVNKQLKSARALAPFEAQYDFDGRQVTYTRITRASSMVRWTRILAEPGIFGNGYTLFLDPAPSLKCVLLLHAPDARLEQLFAQCPPPR